MGGAHGAAGRGLAAAAGARPAGAPWCGRERSMGRRLLRALLCLLLLAGRGLLRDGGASATATAAHGETGAPGWAAPRGPGGRFPGSGRAGVSAAGAVTAAVDAVTARSGRPSPRRTAGEGSLVPARRMRHRHRGRLFPGAAHRPPGAPHRLESCCLPWGRLDGTGAGRCSLRNPAWGKAGASGCRREGEPGAAALSGGFLRDPGAL